MQNVIWKQKGGNVLFAVKSQSSMIQNTNTENQLLIVTVCQSALDVVKQKLTVLANRFEMKIESILTCPTCGKEQNVSMPTNACQHFYKCQNCDEILKPKKGDCCVFCSYADTRCPPKQQEGI